MTKKKTEYERVRDHWYKKLENEGFKDIEHHDGSINIGLPRSVNWSDEELRQITQDYYCMAYHFLNQYQFEDELERIVWEYHAEGLSVRDIAATLKKVNINTSKDRVWRIVKRLETAMKELYLIA